MTVKPGLKTHASKLLAQNESRFLEKMSALSKGKKQSKANSLLAQHRFEWKKENQNLAAQRRELEIELNTEVLGLRSSDAFGVADKLLLAEIQNLKNDLEHSFPEICRALGEPLGRLRSVIKMLPKDNVREIIRDLRDNLRHGQEDMQKEEAAILQDLAVFAHDHQPLSAAFLQEGYNFTGMDDPDADASRPATANLVSLSRPGTVQHGVALTPTRRPPTAMRTLSPIDAVCCLSLDCKSIHLYCAGLFIAF
jgi:hypothetical protein